MRLYFIALVLITCFVTGCERDDARKEILSAVQKPDVVSYLDQWAVEITPKLKSIAEYRPATGIALYRVNATFDWERLSKNRAGVEIGLFGSPERPLGFVFYIVCSCLLHAATGRAL